MFNVPHAKSYDNKLKMLNTIVELYDEGVTWINNDNNEESETNLSKDDIDVIKGKARKQAGGNRRYQKSAIKPNRQVKTAAEQIDWWKKNQSCFVLKAKGTTIKYF